MPGFSVPKILDGATVLAMKAASPLPRTCRTLGYKGGFGLRKRDGKPDEELVGILVGKEPAARVGHP